MNHPDRDRPQNDNGPGGTSAEAVRPQERSLMSTTSIPHAATTQDVLETILDIQLTAKRASAIGLKVTRQIHDVPGAVFADLARNENSSVVGDFPPTKNAGAFRVLYLDHVAVFSHEDDHGQPLVHEAA